MVPESIEPSTTPGLRMQAAARHRKRPGPPPGYGAKTMGDDERKHLLAMEAAGFGRPLMRALSGTWDKRIRAVCGLRPPVSPGGTLSDHCWRWPAGAIVKQRESGVIGVVDGAFSGPGGVPVLLIRSGRGLLVEYAEPDLIELVREAA